MKTVWLLGVLTATTASAHDTWVEVNTNLVRAGDAVTIDLKLGNHGNEHRDFKLASKLSLDENCQLQVVSPDGSQTDIVGQLTDAGYTPTEGYWTTRFAVREPGLYVVAHHLDRIVNHGRPIRSIKSGKTCFVASRQLDNVSRDNPGFDRVFGHPLELVPIANPVTPMGPGQAIKVRLLWQGQPAANERVSFIPRGIDLQPGLDADYEVQTDADGVATFTPKLGRPVLVVAHRKTDDRGDGYEGMSYSATLTVFVPELCPCCAD
jgi:uncharacterized GH25 family protein